MRRNCCYALLLPLFLPLVMLEKLDQLPFSVPNLSLCLFLQKSDHFFPQTFILFQFLISLFMSYHHLASVSLSSFTSTSSHSFFSYLSSYLYPRSTTLTIKHLSLFLPSFSPLVLAQSLSDPTAATD